MLLLLLLLIPLLLLFLFAAVAAVAVAAVAAAVTVTVVATNAAVVINVVEAVDVAIPSTSPLSSCLYCCGSIRCTLLFRKV